jgi:hypothetical protein
VEQQHKRIIRWHDISIIIKNEKEKEKEIKGPSTFCKRNVL